MTKMVPNFHVFDVKNQSTKKYHVRKSHPKTRSGCLTCKQRRVKCDEIKPSCSWCSRHAVACEYPTSKQQNLTVTKNLWPGKKTPLILTEGSQYHSGHDMELLHHFATHVCTHMGETALGEGYSKSVPYAFQHGYLMHAMLATAARYIRDARGDVAPSVIELAHWKQAISSFRAKLETSWLPETDAIISTCMLLNSLSFADDYSTPSIYTSKPFGWLSIQLGLKPLLISSRPWRAENKTIWQSLYDASTDPHNTYFDERSGKEGLPQPFINLFDITSSSTCEDHPYLLVLRKIYPLFSLKMTPGNIIKIVGFIGSIDEPFRILLETKDSRALLLMCWWLALMCQIPSAWASGRAFVECRATCEYLDLRCPEIPTEFLVFPADACGYELRSKVKEVSKIDFQAFEPLEEQILPLVVESHRHGLNEVQKH